MFPIQGSNVVRASTENQLDSINRVTDEISKKLSDHLSFQKEGRTTWNAWAPGTMNGFMKGRESSSEQSQRFSLQLEHIEKLLDAPGNDGIVGIQEASMKEIDRIKDIKPAYHQAIAAKAGRESFANVIFLDTSKYSHPSEPLQLKSIDNLVSRHKDRQGNEIRNEGRYLAIEADRNIDGKKELIVNVHLTSGLNYNHINQAFKDIIAEFPNHDITILGDANADLSKAQVGFQELNTHEKSVSLSTSTDGCQLFTNNGPTRKTTDFILVSKNI
ncbi:endonuclease/exonuclease/phosphatase family protein [Algicola sagamiensis]|uniref:endonuclease/exonuclease/phosphatase family protein n=1 Tax=Algicola sagamiensis TaxID=163869 RepID=UPI000368A8A4|nr:hypothetical protein [Algicola sagamiensis]